MRATTRRTGWLIALRRGGAAGALLFAVVFAIGLVRTNAVALAVGDDVCVFMGGTLPPRLLPSDPSDLSDRAHDCCDLGLCLAAAAAPPPAAAEIAVASLVLARLGRTRRRAGLAGPVRRAAHRPRGPPAP